MSNNPNTYRAILSNSAGEIDRLESDTPQRLHFMVADALSTGTWVLAPGDTIAVIDTTEQEG